jgi:hypothetical protein
MLQFVAQKFPSCFSPLVALEIKHRGNMDNQTLALEAPELAASANGSSTADHKTVKTDADYDVTFHPAFASRAAVKPKNGVERDLYRQPEGHVVHCPGGHPKKHVFKLKGKGNHRDITITIEDPEHSIHSLRLELYDQGRVAGTTAETGDVFTLENNAKTCPPLCDS